MDKPPAIEARGITVRFGKRTVLRDVSFCVPAGELLVVMGGSGSGKSTLLRCLVGLLQPNEGQVFFEGQEIGSLDEAGLGRLRRRMGLLFQSGALFNSMSVGENVATPILETSRVTPEVAELVVKLKLELVGLTGFESFMPGEISGGMKKRVGLARALALDPAFLFCDEPTAGLDPVMTAVIDQLLSDLTRKLSMTSVVVTHDMTSAFRIADRMIMLYDGRILADGTPDALRAHPDPVLQQFIRGEHDGPIPLRLSKDDYLKSLLEPTP
jgi:phospholipid/cholesterol/gamma-HCH transport system ATP-binding protein